MLIHYSKQSQYISWRSYTNTSREDSASKLLAPEQQETDWFPLIPSQTWIRVALQQANQQEIMALLTALQPFIISTCTTWHSQLLLENVG